MPHSHSLRFWTILLVTLFAGPVHAQQTLRWGADPSGGAPYVYTDPANPDRYIGYEKEMVDALAAAMGRQAQFVPSDWETLVSALQRQSFDVIVNGLEPTGDRAQQIAFSNPYYIFQLQLTVRRDENRIHSLADCSNRLVGTLGNTAASRLLEQQKVPYRSYADPVGAYRDLELKRIDAVVMDVPAEAFYVRDNAKLKPAGPPFSRGLYVIGLRKGDDALKAEVDKAIEKIIVDGTLEQILKKWKLWNNAQVEFQTSIKAKTQPTIAFEMTNSSFNWSEALWRLTRAASVTVLIALGSMIIAVLLGLPLAVGQWKGPAWLRAVCTVYVEFFRGTPVLVQLLFLYFGLPVIGIAMPGWLTALVGLGLNYAAYESQVYRASLDAIPNGQWEASYSLGMSSLLAFRRIILPQAFRIALPPMTNDFVSLFKDTSVAFAISVWELATAYRELANASGQFLLLGVTVSLFYLAMSLPMAHVARMLEQRLRDRTTERVEEVEVPA
ncbi:MAG TPA: ABC transporter substrate-binding protein/permease [Pyrinomonadaceae bacterium]|jgi:polar amino acid transport system substrate-binding protein|nr:ABC transporter substrate-binding protein/permease [Pyrinomonadaceae bacterium]